MINEEFETIQGITTPCSDTYYTTEWLLSRQMDLGGWIGKDGIKNEIFFHARQRRPDIKLRITFRNNFGIGRKRSIIGHDRS